ncbi:MAG: hypothetical protein ACE5GL_00965 [Calditrichia bacterium]
MRYFFQISIFLLAIISCGGNSTTVFPVMPGRYLDWAVFVEVKLPGKNITALEDMVAGRTESPGLYHTPRDSSAGSSVSVSGLIYFSTSSEKDKPQKLSDEFILGYRFEPLQNPSAKRSDFRIPLLPLLCPFRLQRKKS